MYGLDGPALLLMPLLWLFTTIWPSPWLYAAALIINAVFLATALADLGWFLDQRKRWLHVALTVLPPATLLITTSNAALLAAVLNLYFAVVPHERVTLAVLASAILPAGALVVMSALLGGGIAVELGAIVVLLVVLGIAAMATSTVSGYDATAVAAARVHAARIPVRTGQVTTEGDTIHYETRGSGPPLLMITGAQGDAGFYTYPAALLADEFQVITYDRRGNSRSSHNATGFDIAQQARDAVAVLRAAGHESAVIFGNSGGAVIALELAVSSPGAVEAVIAHEPPLLTVEPDRKSLALFKAIDRMGTGLGAFVFSMSVGIPFRAYGTIPPDMSPRTSGNQAFFVAHEMQPFVDYAPDTVALASGRVPLIMAIGATTLATNRYYGRPARLLASQLDAPLVIFPGHHISYFDLPMAWTARLRETLHSLDVAPKR